MEKVWKKGKKGSKQVGKRKTREEEEEEMMRRELEKIEKVKEEEEIDMVRLAREMEKILVKNEKKLEKNIKVEKSETEEKQLRAGQLKKTNQTKQVKTNAAAAIPSLSKVNTRRAPNSKITGVSSSRTNIRSINTGVNRKEEKKDEKLSLTVNGADWIIS
ncbi:MAG: hypothetical protein LBB21_03075 [Holosporaceae bacterium]|nr:hypothetical protein [Holosporaceae bacterium]